MSVSNISEHFTWIEAMCHDGTEVPLELQPNARILANLVLEPIRAEFGHAIIPLSWYRTPEWNKHVKGAAGSFHMQALAADIRPASMHDLSNLKQCVLRMLADGKLPGLGGVGLYLGWIHVDARSRVNGHVAKWTGDKIGDEIT